MQMKSDGTAQRAWALRERGSHHIDLTTVCESQFMALALLRARQVHQVHRPACEVVEVDIHLAVATR